MLDFCPTCPAVPARERAARAVAAHPEKSDRAIAAEIGVSAPTVSKARRESTVNNFTVERTGLDGKTRKLPTRPPEIEEPANYRTAYLLRVDQAKQFAFHSGPVTREFVAAARAVAAAWSTLAQKMENDL